MHNLIRVLFLNSFLFPTVNAEHIASTGIYINAVSVWIVFCKYRSHRIKSLKTGEISITICGEKIIMIRALQKADIDSVTDIWLDTNLKAHDSIPTQYWNSNYDLVK